MPEGTDHACLEHTTQSGFAADKAYGNAVWNYNTQLMPGEAQIFKSIARDANNALIRALAEQPRLIVQERRTLSRLPLADYLDLCFVYRDGRFLEKYDTNRQYTSSDKVHHLDSTFGGIVTFNKGENFANVDGSDLDPKIAGLSWIRLWAGEMGFYPTVCTSLDYKGFECDNYIMGGHVITGKVVKKVAKGSNSVYIMPICRNHNNDDSVYMAALTNTKGVWLKNYMGP